MHPQEATPSRAAVSEALPAGLVAALQLPKAYPHDPTAEEVLESVQTHLSHVFLTGDRVYKLRKAVDFGFVSFASRAARNADCLREIALNRRMAPSVYLGIAAVELQRGSFTVGPTLSDPASLGDAEHCVVMRRLPEGRDALSLLESGELCAEQLRRVAKRVAEFHRNHGLGVPAPFTPSQWLERVAAPVRGNFESLGEDPDDPALTARVALLRERSERALVELRDRLERRRADGRAVDGHGDLHLQHVWFETPDAAPQVIDCLEFSEDLRRIDAASELAFLAMDLGYRQRSDLAESLLADYAEAADDYDLYSVVDFFMSYRAAVRGKVAALTARDPAVAARQRRRAAGSAARHIDFAVRALHPPRPGRIYLVGGLVGTGKSTAARAIAAETGAVVLASDRLRRRLLGAPQRTAGWREGRYTAEAVEGVYAALLERAAPVVDSGRSVVLDASWSRRRLRERARAWAQQHQADCVFAEVRCPRSLALARLAQRQQQGRDPSEAGPELYDRFAASFEPLDATEWPPRQRWILDTAAPTWRESLHRNLADSGT